MPRYLISYDVSSRLTRDKLSRKLEKYGQRVQFSLFIVESGAPACHKLVQDLLKIIEAGDSLLCLPVCANCLAAAWITGDTLPPLAYF